MTKDATKTFQEVRKVMGFMYTSCYVPKNRVNDFSTFIERLKAERMLEICEKLEPDHPARIALAQRNIITLPEPEDIKIAEDYCAKHPKMMEAIKAFHQYRDHYFAIKAIPKAVMDGFDDNEYIRLTSEAIAHNHMAAALWREIVFAIDKHRKAA